MAVGDWISVCLVSAFVLQTTKAIFIGGEQDVGSPLRVAQCRATCLERVSIYFDRRKLHYPFTYQSTALSVDGFINVIATRIHKVCLLRKSLLFKTAYLGRNGSEL